MRDIYSQSRPRVRKEVGPTLPYFHGPTARLSHENQVVINLDELMANSSKKLQTALLSDSLFTDVNPPTKWYTRN